MTVAKLAQNPSQVCFKCDVLHYELTSIELCVCVVVTCGQSGGEVQKKDPQAEEDLYSLRVG